MQVSEEDKVLNGEGLEKAASEKAFNFIRSHFKRMEPADIAEAVQDLSEEYRLGVFRLIARWRKAEVFSYLPFETQEDLLSKFPDEAVTLLLNEMEPVDRTQLLEELPPEISRKYIAKLNPDERLMAGQLLSYPEDSVGRLMTPEFLAVRETLKISEAIEYVRWNASNYPEDVLKQIFVVEENGIFKGDITLAGLFVADDTGALVKDVMNESYVTLSPYDDEVAAVDLFRKYDKTFLPVVNDRGLLKGVVMADDVFDVAEEEATEDIHQFGGSASLEDSYFQTTILTLLRKRAGWLAVLFLGGIWSGQALKFYQNEVAAYAFMIIFLPLIISSGGNSGSQAACLIIRGLAIKELELNDWYRVMFREFFTGLGLGLILGSMGFLCASAWGLGSVVGGIVASSLVGVVVFGAVAGAMLPFILKMCRVDPAVSSSPLIASLVDLVGILIFFNVTLWVMMNYSV